MKRWMPLGILLILVLIVVFFLFSPAIETEKFIGEWYSSEDGSMYRFKEGIITCADHSISASDGEIFSGAYCFSKDSVAIYIIGMDGVKELYWEHTANGDILCENGKGSGKVYFYRNREAVPIHK